MGRIRLLLGRSAVVAALVGVGAVAHSGVFDNKAREFGKQIDVKRVARVRIAERVPAYSVEIQYAFADHQTVELSPLGTVPADGSFHFISTEPELVFREKPGGAILMRVVLEETVRVAERPPIYPVPEERLFPPGYISFSWQDAKSLLRRADTVLTRHFQYLPRKVGGRDAIFTTFADLPDQRLPKGKAGRVALLISYPYDLQSDHFEVRVRSLVVDGEAPADGVKPANDEQVKAEAIRFVADVVRQLQGKSES